MFQSDIPNFPCLSRRVSAPWNPCFCCHIIHAWSMYTGIYGVYIYIIIYIPSRNGPFLSLLVHVHSLNSVLCRSTLWYPLKMKCFQLSHFKRLRTATGPLKCCKVFSQQLHGRTSLGSSRCGMTSMAVAKAFTAFTCFYHLLNTYKYRIHNFTTRHNCCQCGLNTPARPWRKTDDGIIAFLLITYISYIKNTHNTSIYIINHHNTP